MQIAFGTTRKDFFNHEVTRVVWKQAVGLAKEYSGFSLDCRAETKLDACILHVDNLPEDGGPLYQLLTETFDFYPDRPFDFIGIVLRKSEDFCDICSTVKELKKPQVFINPPRPN